MKQIFHQVLVGVGSLVLTPYGVPNLRITIPPKDAKQAIGFYFAHVYKDFNRALEKAERANQLEFKLNIESRQT